MIDIAISNRQQLLDMDQQLLTDACRVILAGRGHPRAAISLVVVDNEEMRQLNCRHLDHDYPTDVLSFPLSADDEPLAGEIIVSASAAATNAAEYGTLPLDELLLYVVHGTLHLVGEGDKTPESAEAMRQAEAHWLAQLGIPAARVRALVYPDHTFTQVGEQER